MKLLKRHKILLTVSLLATALIFAAGGVYWFVKRTDDAKAWQLAAQATQLQQTGDTDVAIALMEQAIAIRDDIPEFYVTYGRLAFQAGNLPAAFSSYESARSLEPNNLEALLAVAQLGVQIGEFEKAREAIRVLLLLEPRRLEVRLARGILHLADRKFDDAIEDADYVLTSDPDNPEATVLKARATFLQGERESAADLLRNFSDSHGDNTAVAATEVEVFRELKKPQEMLAALETLGRLQPDNTGYITERAVVSFQLGRQAEALDLIADRLSEQTLSDEEILGLVRTLRLYATIEQVAALAEQIRASASDDAKIEIAKHLAHRGETTAARRLLEDVSGADADHVLTLSDYLDQRDGRGLTAILSTLQDDPTNCFARYVLARANLVAGDSREAVYSSQRAADECPTLLENWEVLALAYDQQDRKDHAERVFKQGMAENPQEPYLYESFAKWAIANDRERVAVASAARLARDMPSYSPVWQSYADLCLAVGASCRALALEGLRESETRFGLDTPPGFRPANGLFGRFLIR